MLLWWQWFKILIKFVSCYFLYSGKLQIDMYCGILLLVGLLRWNFLNGSYEFFQFLIRTFLWRVWSFENCYKKICFLQYLLKICCYEVLDYFFVSFSFMMLKCSEGISFDWTYFISSAVVEAVLSRAVFCVASLPIFKIP